MPARRLVRLLGFGAAASLAALPISGCGGSSGETADGDAPVVVLAASSLAGVLELIDADARYGYAGSNQLARQIVEGAAADVFITADGAIADDLFARGFVERPRPIASNRIVLITPGPNPAGIDGVEDLAAPGVRLVLGAPEVPVGRYARDLLGALGLDAALANVVSEEPDVKSIVGKVVLGEADAGLVYATDIAPAGASIRAIELPDRGQPAVRYAAAVVRTTRSPASARAFVERLVSAAGLGVLTEAGFGPPPG